MLENLIALRFLLAAVFAFVGIISMIFVLIMVNGIVEVWGVSIEDVSYRLRRHFWTLVFGLIFSVCIFAIGKIGFTPLSNMKNGALFLNSLKITVILIIIFYIGAGIYNIAYGKYYEKTEAKNNAEKKRLEQKSKPYEDMLNTERSNDTEQYEISANPYRKSWYYEAEEHLTLDQEIKEKYKRYTDTCHRMIVYYLPISDLDENFLKTACKRQERLIEDLSAMGVTLGNVFVYKERKRNQVGYEIFYNGHTSYIYSNEIIYSKKEWKRGVIEPAGLFPWDKLEKLIEQKDTEN